MMNLKITNSNGFWHITAVEKLDLAIVEKSRSLYVRDARFVQVRLAKENKIV